VTRETTTGALPYCICPIHYVEFIRFDSIFLYLILGICVDSIVALYGIVDIITRILFREQNKCDTSSDFITLKNKR
jgi:hypothetical protein